MSMFAMLGLYLAGCALLGSFLAMLANNELGKDPDERHRARMQLILLPLVWLFWPLVFAAGLVQAPIMACSKVAEVCRKAFPKGQ